MLHAITLARWVCAPCRIRDRQSGCLRTKVADAAYTCALRSPNIILRNTLCRQSLVTVDDETRLWRLALRMLSNWYDGRVY